MVGVSGAKNTIVDTCLQRVFNRADWFTQRKKSKINLFAKNKLISKKFCKKS